MLHFCLDVLAVGTALRCAKAFRAHEYVRLMVSAVAIVGQPVFEAVGRKLRERMATCQHLLQLRLVAGLKEFAHASLTNDKRFIKGLAQKEL